MKCRLSRLLVLVPVGRGWIVAMTVPKAPVPQAYCPWGFSDPARSMGHSYSCSYSVALQHCSNLLMGVLTTPCSLIWFVKVGVGGRIGLISWNVILMVGVYVSDRRFLLDDFGDTTQYHLIICGGRRHYDSYVGFANSSSWCCASSSFSHPSRYSYQSCMISQPNLIYIMLLVLERSTLIFVGYWISIWVGVAPLVTRIIPRLETVRDHRMVLPHWNTQHNFITWIRPDQSPCMDMEMIWAYYGAVVPHTRGASSNFQIPDLDFFSIIITGPLGYG